jgi:DNA-binding HxlR family transcriptional regulator
MNAGYQCPIEATVDVIAGKWKIVILRYLLDGTMRFNELHRRLPGVTQQMLTKQLRELEADGIITRTVYPVVPPRVEYAMTDLGRSLRPILMQMLDWGQMYIEQMEQKEQMERIEQIEQIEQMERTQSST